jgi:hypothetical protein
VVWIQLSYDDVLVNTLMNILFATGQGTSRQAERVSGLCLVTYKF